MRLVIKNGQVITPIRIIKNGGVIIEKGKIRSEMSVNCQLMVTAIKMKTNIVSGSLNKLKNIADTLA